jgi:hypothetical protein
MHADFHHLCNGPPIDGTASGDTLTDLAKPLFDAQPMRPPQPALIRAYPNNRSLQWKAIQASDRWSMAT